MRVEERSWKILRSISLWLAVGAIIMESFGEALESSTGKKETMTTAKEQSFTEDGLVRLKLIPFHAQRRRLRRERQLRRLQGEDIPDESFFDEEDVLLQNRPHQYPRRRLQETSKQVAELLQGYGTHYVDLWVGSGTPQRQTVIVDTGSGVTAFPCSGCDNCGVPKYHSDGLFDQDKSSTFRPLTCDECMQGHCYSGRCSISMSYQEGSSWSAFEAEDQCYAGGLHSDSVTLDPNVVQDDLNPFLASNFAFPLKFGCQTRLTGLFITQLADGIMGLDNADSSYVRQMNAAGVISSHGFSLCYGHQDLVDREGTESGAFTLGGSDKRIHQTPMVWTSTVANGGFYSITIRRIYLRAGNSGDSAHASDPEAQVIPLSLSEAYFQRGRVIVDSGTTDTYFAKSYEGKFDEIFRQLSGMDNGHDKMKMSRDDVRALPTILIQIVGDEVLNQQVRDSYGAPVPGLAEEVDPDHPTDVLLALPATHYMEYDAKADTWTNRFYANEPSGGVIGGNAMMGHDVFFDPENLRIGWAEADCDYSALLAKYDFGPGAAPSRERIPVPPAPQTVPQTPSLVQPSVAPMSVPTVAMQDDAVLVDGVEGESHFCSSIGCQGILVSTVVLVVALLTLRAVNRTSGPSYELSADTTELEMQDPASDLGSDDGIIRYRDEPGEGS